MTSTGCLKCTCISYTRNSTAPLTITLGVQANLKSVASPLTCPLAVMQASSCPLVFSHWSLTQTSVASPTDMSQALQVFSLGLT